VLCNPEVIAANQDALGKQALPVRQTETDLVLAKPMEDGSLAVGLFNLDESPRAIKVAWSELGLSGERRVRDVWRHKDLGAFDGEFSSEVHRHGVVFVRMFPTTK
ncbi:MAG: alpha-galactosidase, partial [Planctomycetota bacterium]